MVEFRHVFVTEFVNLSTDYVIVKTRSWSSCRSKDHRPVFGALGLKSLPLWMPDLDSLLAVLVLAFVLDRAPGLDLGLNRWSCVKTVDVAVHVCRSGQKLLAYSEHLLQNAVSGPLVIDYRPIR